MMDAFERFIVWRKDGEIATVEEGQHVGFSKNLKKFCQVQTLQSFGKRLQIELWNDRLWTVR